MEEKKNYQDLEEDEELATLRLAALATLKSRASKKSEPDAIETSKILPINCITRSKENSTDHGIHKNQHSWRSNLQLNRRRGKNISSKSSQRSNLIVITPIGVNSEKAANENKYTTELILPQHKWCQEVAEDSSSPKTGRRIGPSRFNRHCSESESSDSDYEDSDDSYSNETFLQDEPSQLSQEEKTRNSDKLKNDSHFESELGLQNLEPNSFGNNDESNTLVYNHMKTSCPQTEIKEVEYDQKESDSTYIIKQKNNDTNYNDSKNKSTEDNSPSNVKSQSGEKVMSTNTVISPEQKVKHTPITFDVSKTLDCENPKFPHLLITNQKEKLCNTLHNDISSKASEHKSLRSLEPKTVSLSKNDLRFELKRKKAISDKPALVNRQNKHPDNSHFQQKRVKNGLQSISRCHSLSQELKKYNSSQRRSQTPEKKRRRYSKRRSSHSRSSRSSSSSSSNSSEISTDSSPKVNRSISSVIQPVLSKVVSDTQNTLKSSINKKTYASLQINNPIKRAKSIEIKLKPISNIQISVPGNIQGSNAPDLKKRGPVHMRLGTLSRKRIIQMPKDVEAAFVNTSSDDDNDVNNKCKKSNILVSHKMHEKSIDISKYAGKKLSQKSDAPKTGKVLR